MRVPSGISSFVIVGSAVITGVIVYYATGLMAIGMLAMVALIFAPDIGSFMKALGEGFHRGRNRRKE